MALGLKRLAQGLAIAVVLGLLAVLVWKFVQGTDSVAAAVRGGEQPLAPDFDLPRIDREGRLRLRSLRGKVVVLNFWGSWCYACKGEAPVMEAGWRRWRSRGVAFVGVDYWDFSGDARRFMRKYGKTYPSVNDGPGSLIKPWGIDGAPETFFLRRDGRVVGHQIGPFGDAEQLDEDIRAAMKS
jgi:cytochrome c biogenesis protein CcmG/thiol:disulfide interchange protein DsbE